MKNRPQEENASLLEQKKQLEQTLFNLNHDLKEVIIEIEKVGLTNQQRAILNKMLDEYEIVAFDLDMDAYTFNYKDAELIKRYQETRKTQKEEKKLSKPINQNKTIADIFYLNTYGNTILMTTLLATFMAGLYQFILGANTIYGCCLILIAITSMIAISYLVINQKQVK